MLRLLGLALLLSLVLAAAHALMKYASLSQAAEPAKMLADRGWALALAMLVYVGLFLFYTVMLRHFPLSALFPAYTGLSIVMVSLFSALLFGESIGLLQIVGYIAIIAGVTLVSHGQGS